MNITTNLKNTEKINQKKLKWMVLSAEIAL